MIPLKQFADRDHIVRRITRNPDTHPPTGPPASSRGPLYYQLGWHRESPCNRSSTNRAASPRPPLSFFCPPPSTLPRTRPDCRLNKRSRPRKDEGEEKMGKIRGKTSINGRSIRHSFFHRTINFIVHITQRNIAINGNGRENTATFKRSVIYFPIARVSIMFHFVITLYDPIVHREELFLLHLYIVYIYSSNISRYIGKRIFMQSFSDSF